MKRPACLCVHRSQLQHWPIIQYHVPLQLSRSVTTCHNGQSMHHGCGQVVAVMQGTRRVSKAGAVEATHHKTRPKRSVRPSCPVLLGSKGQLQRSSTRPVCRQNATNIDNRHWTSFDIFWYIELGPWYALICLNTPRCGLKSPHLWQGVAAAGFVGTTTKPRCPVGDGWRIRPQSGNDKVAPAAQPIHCRQSTRWIRCPSQIQVRKCGFFPIWNQEHNLAKNRHC